MDRRAFLAGAAALLVAPLAAEAQQAAKTPQIGYLGVQFSTTPEGLRYWEAFLQGLREQGYVAERNLTIERRYLEGKNERASTFVTDFLQMKVDVIVTANLVRYSLAPPRNGPARSRSSSSGSAILSAKVSSPAWPGQAGTSPEYPLNILTCKRRRCR
jgi:hypothetical protein